MLNNAQPSRKKLKAKRARGNQAPIHPRNKKSYKAVKTPTGPLRTRRRKGRLEVPNAKVSNKIKKAFEKEIAVGAPTTRTNARAPRYEYNKFMRGIGKRGGSRKKTTKRKTTKRKTTKRKTTKKTTKKPKVHKGPRGGKYIIRKGKKVYV